MTKHTQGIPTDFKYFTYTKGTEKTDVATALWYRAFHILPIA